ncbi:hypothetical protein [Halobacterium hubeiense]
MSTSVLFNEVANGTRELTLAVLEFPREFGNRVAAVDYGEDLAFEPQY